MDDITDRFARAIADLDGVAGELTPDEALRTFDETTLQLFWRDWTRVSSWAGALWRALSRDLEDAAAPVRDDLDEVGEPG